jgi:hypothetical protein
LFPMATTVSASGAFLNQRLPLTGSQELYRVYENSGPWVRFRLRPVCQLRRQRGRQCHGPGSPGARDREANVRFPAERVRFIREATRLYHCWFVTTRGVL